ncbi:Histone deacetylase [Cichlidogyrus casuarinus]|uniref:histone deacetylase n=1 Tax=Cichlidogyrus casuarinus TaxID=1844966 RepID=A0ABD2PZT3_9PLAT
MGFCYFNSIAVAAKRLQFLSAASLLEALQPNQLDSNRALAGRPNEKPELPLAKRILILDWDIHHGNGTQSIFYTDSSVLYISLHRHDNGYFFPGTGAVEEMGFGPGLGYSINIAWPPGVVIGDVEYLTAFRCIILPVIEEYQPDIILVSAGFDATSGHPATLGGYAVSPACYGWMTKLLANRKLVLALEGGYELTSLCQSVEACVRALLLASSETGTCKRKLMRLPDIEHSRLPIQGAVECLLKVCKQHSQHWRCLDNIKNAAQIIKPLSEWLNTADEEENEEEGSLVRNTLNRSIKKQRKVDEDDSCMSVDETKFCQHNDREVAATTDRMAGLKVTNAKTETC